MSQNPTQSEQANFDEALARSAPELEVIATEALSDEAAALADETRDDTW